MPRKVAIRSAAAGCGCCEARSRNSLRNASRRRRAGAYEGSDPRFGVSPPLACVIARDSRPTWRPSSAPPSACACATLSAARSNRVQTSLAESASMRGEGRPRRVLSSAGNLARILSMDTVLFHESVQRRSIDARESCCLRHIPARTRHESREILLLEIRHETVLRQVIRAVEHAGWHAGLRPHGRDIIREQDVIRAERLPRLSEYRYVFDDV